MKKQLITLGAMTLIAAPALADGNAFTPLNFDDTAYTAPASKPVSNTKPNLTATPKATNVEAVGNSAIQNAILELDNAQVGIRNELLDYKTKYADVDAQYKLIKNERGMLNKQVKAVEKRIKNIDKAKDKIRKNML